MDLATSEYTNLLNQKITQLQNLFQAFSIPNLEVFPSSPQHFRMRAEFRLWHEGDNLYHVMFNQETLQRMEVKSFPAGSLLMNALMQAILPLLKIEPILRKNLFQIEYLTTLSQKAIITLIYHRNLDKAWQAQAQKLRQELQNQGFDVQIIGRANKQKICLDHDYIDEELTINGKKYIYRQVENSFTQPNAQINQHMLEWAIDCTKNCQQDLLELYCGNGNFSIALAQNFRQVLATEVSKPSVESAQFNIQANNIENLKIIRMSAEDFTQAIQGVREFYRLRDVDLSQYNCQTILVDPPRAGLDNNTLKLITNYQNILYISCNPHSLLQNLQFIAQTHSIQRMALFDQFPYTHHMEVGLWLTRK